MSQSSTIAKIKDIKTPERALMLAFLVCRVQFNNDSIKNTKRGKGAKNPQTSFRQCEKLGAPFDSVTPANPDNKYNSVYGHIDGYFLPTAINDAENWGFVENFNNQTIVFIPLTAPLANRPLTSWVLSGLDVNRQTHQQITTQKFLPSNNTSETQYYIKMTHDKQMTLQIAKSAKTALQGISHSGTITLPTYYDRVFASEKSPPSPVAPVAWSWLRSEI
jgi:hypothetical protein